MGQIILLFVYLFISSFSVYSSVVLNEVAIQPNQTVELYNMASTSADISSWYIDDAGGTTYYTIPTQTILPPKSCLLFTADFNFNKSSADVVRLFDNTSPPTTTSAKLIEQFSYAKAPDANYSFSKKMDGGVEWQIISSSLGLYNETLLSCIPTPTPTPFPTEIIPLAPTNSPSPTNEPTQEPSPTPIPDYQNIFISEIYPYPSTNEHEWVELYNGNDQQVILSHWYVDDLENGGSIPKLFSIILDPYSYGVIDLASSLFNNDGDAVRLLDGSKNEKDSMEYGKITQGKSIGRILFSEDVYCEQEPSKNTVNSSCFAPPIQLVTPQAVSIKSVGLKQILPSPIKNSTSQISQQTNTRIKYSNTIAPQNEGDILGVQTKETPSNSPISFLSFISFSYSLLTIVSIFIKMKYA